MDKVAFIQIIDRWLAGNATAGEELMLISYYNSFQDNNEWNEAELGAKEIIAGRILGTLRAKIGLDSGMTVAPGPAVNSAPVHRVHFLRTSWFRYAAAILIMAGIGAYLWNIQTADKQEDPLTHTQSVPKEILPGGNKALLTLADGSTIVLDSAANGQLATQGSSSIIKTNGQLVYSSGGTEGSLHSPFEKGGSSDTQRNADRRGISAINTMSTPRGGQYRLTLSDGTKVWLNAASSITYPTAFTGNTREVSITGEAYFEVKPNSKHPFLVKTPKEQILVLGTSFNINTYPDEPYAKTSLIEGSIKIEDKILTPGQAFSNNKIIQTNLAQDLAWKNGIFSFKKADIPAVMRQLSRWYNVDVEYKGEIPQRAFTGEIGRNLTLQQVLDILNQIRINYKIEGNKIIISP